MAHSLAKSGWNVLATCRKQTDCDRLTAEGLTSFPIDVSDPSSIASGFEMAMQASSGRIDAIYNNAAYAIPGAVEDLPTAALRAIFETNLFGLHDLTTRAVRVMRKQGHGRIIQCSSVLGLVGIRWRGAYAATKFALEGLTEALRIELHDTPIKVITINPGPIPTKFRVNSIPHFERWIDWKESDQRKRYEASLLSRLYTPSGKPDAFERPPSAVSSAIIKALEASNPRPHYYVTGATYLADGLRRFAPDRLRAWILSKS